MTLCLVCDGYEDKCPGSPGCPMIPKPKKMRGLLNEKFDQPFFRDKLTATGDAMLIEGNTWGDVYWGVCKGQGQNWLGRFLMLIREELHNRNFAQPHYGH